jgi:primosomal protein N' (replication factor Y)
MRVASIVFPSPLPQLDKVFDYTIPQALRHEIQFGVAVRAPFGSSKTLKIGYVIAIEDSSVYEGELQEIVELVSPNSVITKEQYDLAKAVASRQAGIVGELLAVCVPKRSARADLKHRSRRSETTANLSNETKSSVPMREFITPGIFNSEITIHWTQIFIERCREVISGGQSVLVVVPDFRDIEVFEEALERSGMSDSALRQNSSDSVVNRWENHLLAIAKSGVIIYGTRVACFAPCQNLGLILVWDDVDESHHEQSSPYWNSRDVLLQRSELENSSIVFCAHSPSSEISRLVELGYLLHSDVSKSKPLVRITESNERLDTESFALISKTLAEGKPVLIQVANLGFASALACVSCREIQRCSVCHTSLWLDPARELRCRNCKKVHEQLCVCGGKTYRAISIGSHALSEQLERSFPKANVQRSTGSDRLTKVEAKGALVISTPGSEPAVQGGYAVIVLADAQSMVGYPRLRALEQASQKWANALSHLAETGVVIAVGLSGELATQLKAADFTGIVRADMLERSELGLPPACRILSVTAKNHNDAIAVKNKLNELTDLTIVPTVNSTTVAYSYSIANGGRVATDVRQVVESVSKTSKHKLPGQRVLFINMDDNKVL